nr:non-ribosomal peptide synthetase [Rhodococcus sp. T7]
MSVTYREFNARVNRLARKLIAEGAGTDTTVAVAARRSIEFLIALHAVLRSGAAYVPLDVDLPAERVAHVIEAAHPVLVLTAVRGEFESDSGVRVLPMDGLELDRFDDAPVTDRDRLRPLLADNLAYVIFTSGSTGRPKGVAVSHAGLGSHFEFLVSLGALDETDRVAVKTPQSFDASLWELLWPLAVGARVVIAEPDGHKDPDYLAELIDTEQITAIHFVPSMLAVFTDVIVPSRFSSLRTVFVGGEALSVNVARRFAAVSDAAVLNAYGPAEVAPTSTTSWVDTSNSGIVTVGTPVWNTRAYVLDQRLHPTPAGVTGELYLAGTQVSRGYAGRPDLTAERFVANPFDAPGTRMYRTGDRLRWTGRGELEYFGRNDFQVKLRGLRIELGEIEAVLEAADSVAQAVVTVYSGAASEQLVAYLVARTGTTVDIDALTAFAESRLPEYMVPDGFVTLDALPINASGKLDRAALPAPPVGDVAVDRVEPRTPMEETLAALFREALGVDDLGVNDSFFALGGDSIVSIQLVSRAKAAGIVFTPRDVFERKSIAALAEVATAASADRLALAELAGGGVGNVELTPVVRSLFDRSGSVGRYSQSVLLTLPTGIERSDIVATVQAVLDRHDALRSRLVRDGADVRHSVLPAGAVDADRLVTTVPVNPDLEDAAFDALIDRELSAAADRFDFETPVLTQFVWLDRGATRPGRLLVVAHHLVVDGVSWRIIVPDLVAAGGAVAAGHTPNLPEVGTSLRRWSHGLSEAAGQPSTLAQFDYWRRVVDGPDPLLGDRALDPVRDRTSTTQELHVELPTEITGTLLARVPEAFGCSIGDSLLAGFAVALTEWRRARGVPAASAYVTLEGHGREESVVPGADLSRTVGWFTSVYPVRLALEGVDTQDALVGGASAGAAIKAVKEQLRAVPDRGVGYGLLRHLNPATATILAGFDPPQVVFNYLGKTGMGDLSPEMREIGWVPDLASSRVFSGEADQDMSASATIEINVGVTDTDTGPRLGASVRFAAELLAADDVRELVDLWQHALVSQIEHVVAGSGGGLTPSDIGTVTLTQSQIEVWERTYPALEDVWALSPLQAGFHFHSLLAAEHGVDVYHSQLRMTLLGDVSADRMRAAAAALLDRYPNLRVVFAQDGDVTVQIPLRGVEVPLTVVDLAGRESDSGETELEALVAENRTAPFDLSEAPLLRLLLVRTGADRHELAMTNHHILLDGWSIPLIVQDLLVLYATAGDRSALPAVPPYRDYLDWLARRDPSASRAAWAHTLDGFDEPTLLAPARTGGGATADPEEVPIHFSAADTAELLAFARQHGLTPNTVIQTAWALLLRRLTGRDDVVFGATVSGRPPHIPGIDSMVGLFINTVPVRVRIDADESVAGLLERVQGQQADLLEHHYLGLTEIQAEAGVGALFDTLTVFESYPMDQAALQAQTDIAGMRVDSVRVHSVTHYPLSLMAQVDDTLRLGVAYLPDTFDRGEAKLIAARLDSVIRALIAEPSAAVAQVTGFVPGEYARVIRDWNATAHHVPESTLLTLFEAQAARTPDAVAVEFDGDVLTYAALDARANQLARHLIAQGVAPETRVAVVMRRSLELVVGIYAVLKAGGAYVPVDPDHPAERTSYVLASAQPVCVLTSSADRPELPNRIPVSALDTLDLSDVAAVPLTDAERIEPLRPAHPAYVIYTSGSTGKPKGVAVPHAAIVNQLHWMQSEYALTDRDVWLQKTATTFDVSVWGYFWPLQVGATMVLATPDGHREPAYLTRVIDEHAVTVTDFVPSMLDVFVAAAPEGSCRSLRHVFVIGEALPPATVLRFRELSAAGLHNLYGPTEAAVSVTYWKTGAADTTNVPIGVPEWNTQAYVLDARLHPVPVGVPGELYLGGAQLARGYLGRVDLTSDRFVANPFGRTGERMYRTGDLVRWTSAGALVYIGRTDFQVKFRGQRIELGEIETVLRSHPAVTGAVVSVYSDTTVGDHLIAYVVGTPGDVDVAELRRQASESLPSYMVPSAITVLDEFPLNTSGKLDRTELPAPEFHGSATEYIAPRNEAERTVAAVFADVLGAPGRIGAHDNFFDLGGNSLSVTRVAARLGELSGTAVSVRDVFTAPTVAELALRLAEPTAAAGARPVLSGIQRPDRIPLSPAQQRMWFINQFDPASPAYNLPLAIRMSGALDVTALSQALDDVVGRHESLRTVFPDTEDGPAQVVVPAADLSMPLEVVDVPEGGLDSRMIAFSSRGFDVSEELPVRATLFRTGPGEHVLAITLHHIAADGWSFGPLGHDVMTAYAARAESRSPEWIPLAVQYADYSVWHRAVLGSEDEPESLARRQLDYWTRTLDGLPDELKLPFDRPRRTEQSYAGGSVGFTVTPEIHRGIERLAREHTATVFMVARTPPSRSCWPACPRRTISPSALRSQDVANALSTTWSECSSIRSCSARASRAPRPSRSC